MWRRVNSLETKELRVAAGQRKGRSTAPASKAGNRGRISSFTASPPYSEAARPERAQSNCSEENWSSSAKPFCMGRARTWAEIRRRRGLQIDAANLGCIAILRTLRNFGPSISFINRWLLRRARAVARHILSSPQARRATATLQIRPHNRYAKRPATNLPDSVSHLRRGHGRREAGS